jgi:flagellar basal-body rod protein FlgG
MSDAFAIAASGLKAENHFIDALAHDLANLNTPNYKASRFSFIDLMSQNRTSLDRPSPLGLGTALIQSGRDFSTGPLKVTNNWNDVAINGQGFYQVIQPDGNLAYTRNSTFTIDADHYLCTLDGFRLADNIQIPEEFSQLSIQANGDVEATLYDDSKPRLLGTIQLAQFMNPKSLELAGSGLYTATEASGEPFVDIPGVNGLGLLTQNHIEGSNVDMVNTLMQLTMAQRIYQINAKAMQIADELERLTNEIRN